MAFVEVVDESWMCRMPTQHLLRPRVRGGVVAAWNAIVDRFAGLVWGVARRHRLSASDAADVSQTTWLRLVEHIDRIQDPERVGGWLATTARHEALRVLRISNRELPSDPSA